ncbi:MULTISPECIES: DUF1775 domain-containing protein [Kitasatospora]|uniref:YncI copper-binding domain-containing protein n=2 Tax=Kitasatospora TaxID=2063 RepID=A0ABT1J469_9ACTN|nr:DUF1775 domain-containing protein [Kitasatospora paracochleata]MCP2312218.1 hypothetical protein [Kitasatospora paracochleata]
MQRTRLLARVLTPVAALGGTLALAVPAFAHVEVEADHPQALAKIVMIDFNAEGESDTAGITEIKVALPTGIASGDIVLTSAPSGWKLTPSEGGYTVSGPALAPGADAKYAIKVMQLPDAKELAFKSLVGYSDGHVDRWIELPQAGVKPEHPAPVLTLSPAAPGSTPQAAPAASLPAPSVSASSGAPAAPTAATPAAAPAAKTSSGGSGVVVGVVVAVVVALLAALVWRRRSAR